MLSPGQPLITFQQSYSSFRLVLTSRGQMSGRRSSHHRHWPISPKEPLPGRGSGNSSFNLSWSLAGVKFAECFDRGHSHGGDEPRPFTAVLTIQVAFYS